MRNTSAPICVLRVGGTDFDVDAALTAMRIKPYRVDRASMAQSIENVLFFDVADADAATEEISPIIEAFLIEHCEGLRRLHEFPGVTYFELDIGVVIESEMMSRSTTLEPKVMTALAALNMTCIISAYRGGED